MILKKLELTLEASDKAHTSVQDCITFISTFFKTTKSAEFAKTLNLQFMPLMKDMTDNVLGLGRLVHMYTNQKVINSYSQYQEFIRLSLVVQNIGIDGSEYNIENLNKIAAMNDNMDSLYHIIRI